jgi:hypothetical protein
LRIYQFSFHPSSYNLATRCTARMDGSLVLVPFPASHQEAPTHVVPVLAGFC